MKKLLVLSLFAAVLFGCSAMRSTPSGESVSIEGQLTKLGMTTYQYGTHSIASGGKPFALRSGNLNLDTYIDKQVLLKGVKVKGYPLEGGPELIEVTEIRLK